VFDLFGKSNNLGYKPLKQGEISRCRPFSATSRKSKYKSINKDFGENFMTTSKDNKNNHNNFFTFNVNN